MSKLAQSPKSRLASPTIYETVANEGREELARPYTSLAWSGMAAGVCISFALLGEAYLKLALDKSGGSFLIENIGYTFGFLLVIIGRLQLFTENTITVILPLLENKSMKKLNQIMKLWGVVFSTNMAGTMTVAILLAFFGFASADQLAVMIDISKHAIIAEPLDVFVRGIPAGFLIAALVWMMPSSKSPFLVIFFVTYLIAIGDFTHVVAGSAEAFLLALKDIITFGEAFTYIACAGLGNILGGTGLFALLAYAQVKHEMQSS